VPLAVKITYLGHAGFCVEDDRSVIVMDPWLSPEGAFDSAWFQFPPNGHMAEFVADRLADSSRERFVYVSHEHHDHFDLGFLERLTSRDFTLVIPHFRRATLLEQLAGYRCRRLAALTDRERIPFGGGWLRLYLDDSSPNRDSALLVRMGDKTFFNMNDCKLFDRIDEVREDAGTLDVFACQFSGATWHPTCYQYEGTRYAAISKQKSFAKFESVARAIERLEPATYVPSAGPPCFLDPELYHLNFEASNIFSRFEKLEFYLKRRLRKTNVELANLGPGGTIDVAGDRAAVVAGPTVAESEHAGLVESYAKSRRELFNGHRTLSPSAVEETLARLRLEFAKKLASLSLANRVDVPLYFALREREDVAVKVDFHSRTTTLTQERRPEEFYELVAPAWQVRRVLEGALTWEEFSLTFRVRIRRNPDIYQPVIHAFLLMDADDLAQWCAALEALEARQERIAVTCDGREYSVLRYCPHQGGDLAQGWMEGNHLVCPRHHWRFDITRGGTCTSTGASIEAIAPGLE